MTGVTDPDMIYRQYPGDHAARPPGDPIVLLVTHFDQDAGDKQSEGDPPKAPKHAIDVLPQEPVPHCSLRARVWMLYEERKVQSGREFYAESKQSVWLKHDAEDKQDVEIMSADEVSPAMWSLKLCQCAVPGTGHLSADGHAEDAERDPEQDALAEGRLHGLWRGNWVPTGCE